MVLTRLPPKHAQHVRCRRAATENIKADFFGSASNYSGINVQDVYKLENKPLLKRFQSAAASLEPGKVKGHFCPITITLILTLTLTAAASLEPWKGQGLLLLHHHRSNTNT